MKTSRSSWNLQKRLLSGPWDSFFIHTEVKNQLSCSISKLQQPLLSSASCGRLILVIRSVAKLKVGKWESTHSQSVSRSCDSCDMLTCVTKHFFLPETHEHASRPQKNVIICVNAWCEFGVRLNNQTKLTLCFTSFFDIMFMLAHFLVCVLVP